MTQNISVADNSLPRAGFPLFIVLLAIFVLSALVSLATGRSEVPLSHVGGILAANLLPIDPWWSSTEARVVELIRIPRILMAALAGAGLAIAGAALQGIFPQSLSWPADYRRIIRCGFRRRSGYFTF